MRDNPRGAVTVLCVLALVATACSSDGTATTSLAAGNGSTVTSTSEPATTTSTMDPDAAIWVDAYVDAFMSLELDQLESLPWREGRAPDEVITVQAFMRGAGAVFGDAACVDQPTGSVCTLTSEDGFTPVLGTSYADVHTIVITDNTIIRVTLEVDDSLDDFWEWAETNRPDLFDPGGVCHSASANPAWDECAATLVQVAAEYVQSDDYEAP